MTSSDRILQSVLRLVREDPELKEAILEWIRARTKAEFELAAWRHRRGK